MFISSSDAQHQKDTSPEVTPKGREEKAGKGMEVRNEKEPRDWPTGCINQEVVEANMENTHISGSLWGLFWLGETILF